MSATTHGSKNPEHDTRTTGHVNLFDPVSATWACLTCNVWHHPDCGCLQCSDRPMRPADFEFNAPHAYKHAHAGATEREAARAVLPLSAKARRRVFDHLTVCGGEGATDIELADRLGMNPSTVRPRRLELVESGVVVDSGETRLTSSGRRAVVWIVSGLVASESSDSRRSGADLAEAGFDRGRASQTLPQQQETR